VKKERQSEAIERRMPRFEAIEGLRHALDNSYRRFRESARRDWKQLFTGKDPSDTSVRVRISVTERGLRGSDFLPKRKSAPRPNTAKLPYPRLAH
jgi:hypothetical protein